MIDNLSLKRFTVFENAVFNFSPRVNVIIGENGAGKTHLLKTAYALSRWHCQASLFETAKKTPLSEMFTEKLVGIFFQQKRNLEHLHRRNSKGKASLEISFANGPKHQFQFGKSSRLARMISVPSLTQNAGESIFIPAKEVLSFLCAITDPTSDDVTIKRLLDESYLDLCRQLVSESKAVDLNRDPRLGTLVPVITNAIGGKFQIRNGQLWLRPGKYVVVKGERSKATLKSSTVDEDSMDDLLESAPQIGDDVKTIFAPSPESEHLGHTTAEGFRKLGVLQLLLSNGVLSPGGGGTLLWDEPESNVNPALMRLIVQAVLELSRNGQQIILATHDYVLLKWLDLLTDSEKEDHVRYFTLTTPDEANGVTVQTSDSYASIGKHAIADTFTDLYEGEIARALGDIR